MFRHSVVVMALLYPLLIGLSPVAAQSSRPTLRRQPQITHAVQQVQAGSMTRGSTTKGAQAGSAMRGQAATQGSGSSSRSTGKGMPAAAQTFEQKLWNYLLRAKYRNWAPVPGNSEAMYEGQSPHGAFLKMYLNRTAAGDTNNLRNGSIVIKENYSPDKALAAITVMYKTKGYHPEASDWYWVKFNPDGSVANKPTPTGPVRLAGRVQGCIDCHSGAEGDDFAFFNDGS